MKLSVTRDSLHAGLGAVSATIPTKTTLPVLSNILLGAADGRLTLSGTDLDISVSVSIEAEIAEPGSVTVPARKFAEIARELPAAPVHIETDGVEIRIESGKSRFKLFGLAPEEFPSAPEVDFADS
ncbi:MAG: DNA polymerase III subunit beta, partial [Gemmatimonadota bacterium]|nr:DNA polymerase III subunit beta [Gemmatimonadota bacterium]